ncbi:MULTISPECIES: sensor histidine kinase [Streptomyces]|uniref:sensor histidine kinase n=2 Tax=Streptomyces scabiei TaxID=1930 RepID=UPI0004E6E73C|nr:MULTISPECIES: histidine kinase [Streptomyces]MBP5865942.1 two-component sensor histidine kinase [Streptomyces sp. LBUM 1484]MBP5872647.1 two-component sensor histidine kinase [Streptomyces sp. LBUM 1485]MBP5934047.1 two-component sensor histidine kinase [Streptomyces sp. LBUM 1479]KFG03924.1 histidine kinase [Streptomyces scabiei]MBP5873327.1 two-component sensor histidine kinase [Streptomyces sp. LBUM 1477]
MNSETSPRRRAPAAAGWILLGLLGLLDVFANGVPDHRWTSLLPMVSGPLVCLALLRPAHRPSVRVRGALVAGGSLVCTIVIALWASPNLNGTFGGLESVAALVLLSRVAGAVPRSRTGAAVAAALAVAIIAIPQRFLQTDLYYGVDSSVTGSLVMALGVGLALAWGLRGRLLEEQRARDVAAVRQRQRLELAHDLHDFVAHHVTGIIVQANAALALQHSAPEQITPLLENISRSGSETLDSMRRLVRVLREDDRAGIRPGQLWSELGRLVSTYSDDEANTRLHIAATARDVRLAPEVETSVHRVVQEALTNVRRHAPGAAVAVRIDTDGHRLRVEVHNSAPDAHQPGPVGGRGGLGLVGLSERVEAVEGTLTAVPTDDGGWRVTAAFPTLAAVAGSPA